MDFHGRNLLHLAARGDHIDTYDYLVSKGLDTKAKDEKGDSLIDYASSGGSLQILDAILDTGLKSLPRSRHWTPLHWACRAGNSNVVERLVKEGLGSEYVEITKPKGQWSPISIATFHGNGEILEELSASCRALLGEADESLQLHSKRHGFYGCDGCSHVSKRFE